jgi:hypothetical protein
MSSPAERRSPFLRVLDALLQEENIKWLLGLGVCILLGSSLRLVTLHWSEYTPVWKYLILLTYSAVVFSLGQLSYHRMGLRKTGTVLMALTVLLIPISFLALHWIRPGPDDGGFDLLHQTGISALLVLNLFLSSLAAWRIFHHFLRKPQPTFFACYLILCLAGAIVLGLPSTWSPLVALGLWAVLTAGVVKVNRHVFWLTEEHRLPRIFGFFPILLLGAQFAAVFLLGLGKEITIPWMGLLCTLISFPILLTADALARVFEQRTGSLVRPIPWGISGPLMLGTFLSVAGVILALTGWPANTTIVPTAIIAAIVLGIVAQRTQNGAFVWAMLFCIVIAYQTSPVFFKEILLQWRDRAATAVGETRLPYAFYGLTYFPLIVVLTLASVLLRRRGSALFADPLQKFVTVLPCLLLGVSFTHPSAVAPVALVLCPLFALQIALFRQTSYQILASTAFLCIAVGTPWFVTRAWGWEVLPEMALLIWVGAAGLLLVPGYFLDGWAKRLSATSATRTTGTGGICQYFSLAATLAAATAWLFPIHSLASHGELGLEFVTPVCIGMLLVCHALRWMAPGLGEVTLVFITAAIQLQLFPRSVMSDRGLEGLCWILLAQWGLSYLLPHVPLRRIAGVFGPATRHVSLCALSVLYALACCQLVSQHWGGNAASSVTILLMVVWGLDASRRTRNGEFAAVAWCTVLIGASAVLTTWLGPIDASVWWTTGWAATALVLFALQRLVTRWIVSPTTTESRTEMESDDARRQILAWMSPLDIILPALFFGISLLSLLSLGWPPRLAAGLSIAGLLLMRPRALTGHLQDFVFPIANWQVLAAAATALSGRNGFVLELTAKSLGQIGLPLAVLAAGSAWLFESQRIRRRLSMEVVECHQFLLLIFTLCLLGGPLQWIPVGTWSVIDHTLAAVTWAFVAGTLLTSAVRTQERDRVWWSEAAGLAALIYFLMNRGLTFNIPGLDYILILAGLSLWTAGNLAESGSQLAIISGPFRLTGFCIPLLVLPIAIYRQMTDSTVIWVGANSLPLLAAAAFYFWHGLHRRRLGTTVLSAVLLNAACLLLWKDLSWTDPQLFLMPLGVSILVLTTLMRQEIPAAHHDKLRYAGSLMILVSPVFHIVTGSWWHILTLMVVSVLLALTAILLRVRSLLYTSTAFLLADLVAMVARGSVDEPNVLWAVGVLLGAAIIALGAACENHRESILARLRYLAAELEQWA